MEARKRELRKRAKEADDAYDALECAKKQCAAKRIQGLKQRPSLKEDLAREQRNAFFSCFSKRLRAQRA